MGNELMEVDQIASGTLVRSADDGMIDKQVTTAKRYPRNIAVFKDRARMMACLDEETAASCLYAIPRAGKTIEGPSVRLAEIVTNCWGNIRAEARVEDEDDRYVYATAVAWDIETNIAYKAEIRRRITDKQGRKFNDDMIAVTGQAACSIAMRNAIFKVVPFSYVKEVYNSARKVAIGDAKTMANQRSAMLDYFQKMGATPDRVFAAIGRKSIEEITPDDLAKLKGVATAIKDGEITVDTAFPELEPEKKPDEKPNRVNASAAEKLKGRSATQNVAAQATQNNAEISESTMTPWDQCVILARELGAEAGMTAAQVDAIIKDNLGNQDKDKVDSKVFWGQVHTIIQGSKK